MSAPRAGRTVPRALLRWFAHILRARPRFWLAIATVTLIGWLLPDKLRLSTRLLIAWDSGCLAYLVLIGSMIARSNRADLQRRADRYDQGKLTILLLTLGAAAASIGAIIAEFVQSRTPGGPISGSALTLGAATVVLSWTVVHTLFALHYAHEFYDKVDGVIQGGIAFPGTGEPDYGDFLYVSFVIGCAAQTADVSFTSSPMRRLALLHGVLSFFYNTAILALTINIAAGLVGSG